jgi:hypothetical protein
VPAACGHSHDFALTTITDAPGGPGRIGHRFALNNRGKVTFWRTGIYYFNPVD